MECYILLICLCLLYTASYLIHRKRISRLPPGPTGLPILGSLLHLGPQPHRKLAEWANHYGPLMTVYFGFKPTIVVSSAELAKEIFHKHDSTFSSRPLVDVMNAMPNSEGLIAWRSADQSWRTMRRICSNYLTTPRQVESMQWLFEKKIQELTAHIEKHCYMGTTVDIGQLSFATILNFLSNLVFSVDIVDTNFQSAGKFKDLIWQIMELAGVPNVSDIFPALRSFDLQGLRGRVMHSYSSLFEIFEELIEKRLMSRASNSERNGDLLDVLLDECQESGSLFSRQMIKPLILEIFFAASDTSSITIEWAMTELLRNPSFMHNAQEELTQVIGSTIPSSRLLNIDELPYLEAIIKETFRHHPPSPFLLPHMAGRDIDIHSFNIKKGTRVLINAWAIARDSKYWDDPFSFKPERFVNSDIDYKGKNFEFIPFGAGRRICAGWPLATRMVFTILAALIHSFNWKFPDGVSPENLDMQERFGISLRKSTPLIVVPCKR